MLFRLDDAVIVTRALAAPVADEALSPAELGLVHGASGDLRPQELRAGRACAKEALREAGAAPVPSVLRDDAGRPRLEPPGLYFVSIAHDAGLVAAAVGDAPLGIDLLGRDRLAQATAVVSRRLETGRARGLEPGSLTPWDAPLMLWTAWEALGKRSGAGVLAGAMLERLHVASVDRVPTALTATARLRWFEVDGALLCLATARPAGA